VVINKKTLQPLKIAEDHAEAIVAFRKLNTTCMAQRQRY
jgi:hypothetical protein